MAKYGLIIASLQDPPSPNTLKKAALFFDKIYINHFEEEQLEFLNSADNQYLQDEGIIEVYSQDGAPWEKLQLTDDVYKLKKRLFQLFRKQQKDFDLILNPKFNLTDEEDDEMLNIVMRLLALHISQKQNEVCVPILESFPSVHEKADSQDVLRFILKQVPEPADNTPWEDIIDFRKDENAKRQYNALINWMNNVAANKKTLVEAVDEYNYLLSEYQHSFKLHRMKTQASTVEVVIGAGLDFIQALVTGAWVSSIGHLVTMRQSKIKLLEEETKLPGRELAYIVSANSKFK